MAAPRLHMINAASRAAASGEDEEVEVLRSGGHDGDEEEYEDDEEQQGHNGTGNGNCRLMTLMEEGGGGGGGGAGEGRKHSEALSSSSAEIMRIDDQGRGRGHNEDQLVHQGPEEDRSETSTPEADANEAVMAALFASTRSEAVADHQQASDVLQDRRPPPTSGGGADGGGGRRPSAGGTTTNGASRPGRLLSGGVRNQGQGQGQSGDLPPSAGGHQASSTPNEELDDEAERRRGFGGLPPSSANSRESFWSEDDMRRALQFFFMNPLEKYMATKRFPWKLSLQIVKIFLVTTQLIVFGDMRMGHANFSSKSQTALRHLFLANWTSDRDLLIYPPTVPPFSIYEVPNFYTHLTYAVRKYYLLPNISVATLVYDCHYDAAADLADTTGSSADKHIRGGRMISSSAEQHPLIRAHCPTPPLQFCLELLQAAESHLDNHTYHYDMRTITTCLELDLSEDVWNSSSFSIKDILSAHNLTIQNQKFLKAVLTFKLKTIHLKRLQPADEPDCFHLLVDIVYDNTAHTGDIAVSLNTLETYIDCEGSIQFPTYDVALAVLVSILDASVLLFCVASLALCMRAVIRAQRLFKITNQFFMISFGHGLGKDDSFRFINFWYLLIMVNDVCLIMGTIFKISIEYSSFDASIFTATGMLLGVGTLIVWAGVLRYLAFFPKYNVLVVTLKRALPNVLRFMACAGLLYAGFVFCGWVVLGPYHMKFRTLMMTSECLFALLNGDDMFATFATTSNASPAVLWFARLYLYLFISLFTYVVLSLFISIIMEAYEVIKDRQQYSHEHSDLESFMGIGGHHLDGDNSAAPALLVPGSSTLAEPSGDEPGGGGGPVTRLRRRLSRQSTTRGDDTTPYVRFDNEPVVIIDNHQRREDDSPSAAAAAGGAAAAPPTTTRA